MLLLISIQAEAAVPFFGNEKIVSDKERVIAASYGLDSDWLIKSQHPFNQDSPSWNNPDYSLGFGFKTNLATVSIDTTATDMVFTLIAADGSVSGVTIMSQDSYLQRFAQNQNPKTLSKNLSDKATKPKTSSSEHVEIDIPFKVKSKTFRRIFGSGRIGLNVTGSISASAAYSSEKRESESVNSINKSNGDFKLEQTQQFTVVGKIGEKVDVHIDQDTERSFDFENSLSIVYRGEPEEIIESLEAGNISLALPGTQYVSFSDKSSGLFGLKMVNRFGPLRITGIASSEKSESKQQSFEGSSSVSSLETGPGNWVTDKYFINEYYQHRYRIYNSSMEHSVETGARIAQFALYVLEPIEDPAIEITLLNPDGSLAKSGYRVKEYHWPDGGDNLPFTLDPDLGIITYRRSRSSSYVSMGYLAEDPLVYSRSGYEFETGDLEGDSRNAVVLIPEHFNSDAQPFWDLQLFNVYYTGGIDVDPSDFLLTIEKNVSGSQGETKQNNDQDYRSLFYLDLFTNASMLPGSDQRIDQQWLDPETGNLWFPSPFPFGDRPEGLVLIHETGSTVVVNEDLSYPNVRLAPNFNISDIPTPDPIVFEDGPEMDAIYTISNRNMAEFIEKNTLYTINSEAQVGTDIITLGWNVANVVVTANGSRLTIEEDYSLDEIAGIIRITNPQYRRADQKIVVNYETPALFQLRKKTFAGVTANLDMWEGGNLSAAAIYYNEETVERKIRLGNEPIKNVILDVKGTIKLNPKLMTDWMDALPLIEADAPSSLDFSSEYAMILPDPNPSNNPATGDYHGVAYVDDFESSKQKAPLSLSRSVWFNASKPANENEILSAYQGRIGWFNPQSGIPSSHIWPESTAQTSSGSNNDVRILRVEYDPFHLADEGAGSDNPFYGSDLLRTKSWGGIYYSFQGIYDDLSDKKFLELTLRIVRDVNSGFESDRSGYLNIDLGIISEDIIPNEVIDFEGDFNSNELRDSDDIGFDRMVGPDPEWPLPNNLFQISGVQKDAEGNGDFEYDFWDINGDSYKQSHEPWSWDDYEIGKLELHDPSLPVDQSNGLEGNSTLTERRYPDSEDRDGDRIIDTENNYFSYRIPLNPSHPDYNKYVSERAGNEWIFIRIPLRDDNLESIGNPKLNLMEGIRLWFTGFTNRTTVDIAEFNIVGNEWREAIVADSDTSYHDITVLNNFDNTDDYVAPDGVEGNKDNITGIVEREQSLVIDVQHMPYNKIAWVKKQLITALNFSEYKELKMFVHGGTKEQVESGYFDQSFGDDDIEIRFRLQTDPANYYEYSKFVKAGWDPNDINIKLADITSLESFTDASRGQEEPDKPFLLSDGGQVIIEGNPSINQVRALLLGVKNHSSQPITTQIWFNELRLSGVKRDIGRAFRVNAVAKFSDVLTLNALYEQKDAEFHNVKVRRVNNQELFRQASFSGSTDLGRLFPPRLGISAKVGANYKNEFRLPKYFPNDDREIDPDDHPEFVEKVTTSRGSTITLKKLKSENWLAKNILDKSTLKYDISESVSRNITFVGDTTITQSINYTYSNTLKWKHKLEPFGLIKKVPVIGGVFGTELSYMPSSFSFGASTSRRFEDKVERNLREVHTEKYDLRRNWSIKFAPLKPLSISLRRDYSNNLIFERQQITERSEPSTEHPYYNLWSSFYTQRDLWQSGAQEIPDSDHSINQKIDFSYNPQLLTWLKTTFNYNTTYKWGRTLQQPYNGTNLSNSGNFSANITLESGSLLQKMIFMSDTKLNEAKGELTALKEERLEEKAAKKEARRIKKEEKRAAKEAKKEDKIEDENSVVLSDTTHIVQELPEPGTPVQLPTEIIALNDSNDVDQVLPDSLSMLQDFEITEIQIPDSTQISVLIPDTLQVMSDSLGLAHENELIALPDSTLSDSLDIVPEVERETWFADRFVPAVKGKVKRGWQRVGVKGTSLFDKFNLTYNRSNSHDNPLMGIYPWQSVWDRHAGLLYQLALSDDPEVEDAFFTDKVQTTRRSLGHRYDINTKLNLIKNLPLSLKYSYAFDQGYANDIEDKRNKNETAGFAFSNTPLFGKAKLKEGDSVGNTPSALLVPDYQFNISSIKNIGFLSRFIKSVGLSHTYSGELTTTYTKSATTNTMRRRTLTFVRNFAPFAGFNLQFHKGWSGNLDFKMSTRLVVNDPDDVDTRSMQSRMSREWRFSANKTLSKGLKLPWSKKKLKNNIRLKLSYSAVVDTSVNSIEDTESEITQLIWKRPENRKDNSVTLDASFDFSKDAKGGASFSYGISDDGNVNGKKSYTEFKINGRFNIRSRN
jgi:hypothetical protein